LSLSREQPRFIGSSEHSLDEKGRLVVPARYRERLGQHFILTIALPDPCLALYPLEAWEQGYGRRLDEAAVKDKRYRRIVRHIMQHTEEVTLDTQHRFSIPLALRRYAGIERDVVSLGSNTRLELWAKERLSAEAPTDDEAEAFTSELSLY
jgi:MraZ protein